MPNTSWQHSPQGPHPDPQPCPLVLPCGWLESRKSTLPLTLGSAQEPPSPPPAASLHLLPYSQSVSGEQ